MSLGCHFVFDVITGQGTFTGARETRVKADRRPRRRSERSFWKTTAGAERMPV